MRNKKGFTLIELLAVIVILAIIALIATPMIMGVIDKAKKGSVEASALGYIEGIENYSIYGLLDNKDNLSGVYEIKAVADNNKVEIEELGIEFKGDTPTDGWVAVNDKGIVVAACLKFKMYSKYVGYNQTARAKATLDGAITTPADVAAAITAVSSIR